MSSQAISALHLIDHMGLGGAQRAVGDQTRHRPGDRVFILNRWKKNISIKLDEEKIVYQGAAHRLESLLLPFYLIRCLKRESFDILHCHLNASWVLGLLMKIRYGRNIRVIFHERGGILTAGIFYKLLARLCTKFGTMVAISQNVADHLCRAGVDPGKIEVIYNGLDTSVFRSDKILAREFRNRFGFSEKDFLLGFAGRFEAYKGWEDYLQTFILLNKEYNDLRGIIAGDGPDIENIQATIAELGLSDQIKIIGHIGDMVDYYNALDVFIFPSRFEPLGRTQLEAQACGTVVIACDIPGISETISGENAILVPPRSPAKIAEAVRNLRSTPGFSTRLIHAGQDNVRKFEYRQHLEKIEQLYKSLQGERNGQFK